MNLQRLVYLVHKKNMLNQKRRRFYSWMNLRRFRKAKPINGLQQPNAMEFYEAKAPMTMAEAMKGYHKAQTQMKAMTHGIRSIRVALGARFDWNDSGAVRGITLSDGTYLASKDFKKMFDSEVFEKVVLK